MENGAPGVEEYIEWGATTVGASVRTHAMLVLRDRMLAATRDVGDLPGITKLMDAAESMDKPHKTDVSDLAGDLFTAASDAGYLRGVLDGVRLAGLLPAGEVEFVAQALIARDGFKPGNAARFTLGMAVIAEDEMDGGCADERDGIALPEKPGNPARAKAVA